MKPSARKVLCVFGTRPEAIKMAPVVTALSERGDVDCRVCVTAQHRHMLDQVLSVFGVPVHHDLNVMTAGQTLPRLTSQLLVALDPVLEAESPDAVLVQGDTTTAFAAALAAFYRKVPVGHVEAGLRTGDLLSPWPEEANRQLVGRLARYHFAPTERARENLLREGVSASDVFVTGNTVIDALLGTAKRIASDVRLREELDAALPQLLPGRRLILVTAHRRESFGEPLRDICRAIRELAARDDVQVVFPVHPNPIVVETVKQSLGGLPNVFLIDPQDYVSFVYLMTRAELILTDSGGVQEEAPSLGKPVLVLREVTERGEGVDAGTLKLVGTDAGAIIENVRVLLEDAAAYATMAQARNPYGDGTAARQIAALIASGGA